MFVGVDRHADVCSGKHGKYQSLHHSCKNSEYHHWELHRYDNDLWNNVNRHTGENRDNGFFSKDVAVKTDCKRKRPGKLTDNVNRKHQRRKPKRLSHKMLQPCLYPGFLDPYPVVVDKHDNRQRSGDIQICSRRFQTGN